MKKTKFWHTSRSAKGMGDYYGEGIRQPMAKIVEWTTLTPTPKKKLGKPPKSLA